LPVPAPIICDAYLEQGSGLGTVPLSSALTSSSDRFDFAAS
jgi:hypothetical protein